MTYLRTPIRYGEKVDVMDRAVKELVLMGAEALAYKVMEQNVEIELLKRQIEKLKK